MCSVIQIVGLLALDLNFLFIHIAQEVSNPFRYNTAKMMSNSPFCRCRTILSLF